ncbi:hypothetical protein ACFCYB_07930 [Streptomyces sp. NPDC056309]|uniref:hypothetical protein n=1 Tax=unclassified Streptomyces TaxID=2593676 RepID=UPI0035D8B24E
MIEWRQARDAGALDALIDQRTSPVRPKKAAEQAELERLRKKVARLEKDLARRDAALEVMGKANALLLGTALRERGLKLAAAPVIDEAFAGVQGQLGTTTACRLTGRSRATHYRHLSPKPKPEPSPRPTPASALSPAERASILELLNRPEYVDLPPAQVWARELDAGNYWCPERTMYRILSDAGQSGERRRQATHPPRTIPELVATGPSQVFTWDITRLPGPAKGIWFHAYVIIDIFSRYIVGHTVELAETAERAEELIRDTIERNGIVPHTAARRLVPGRPNASTTRTRPGCSRRPSTRPGRTGRLAG